MEVTHSIVRECAKPAIVLRSPSFPSSNNGSEQGWEESSLNPKNRTNALHGEQLGWRIDGTNVLGRLLYAVPTFIRANVPPLGIHVWLPKEDGIPAKLRGSLDYSTSVVARHGSHIAGLGISRHVCRALDHHCCNNPGFADEYLKLPFGSKLVFERVTIDPAQMKPEILPAFDFERKTKSIQVLQKQWQDTVPLQDWPSSIDVDALRLKRTLHDSVAVVTIPGVQGPEQEFVFKFGHGDVSFLYHELHFLLRSKEHPHVIGRPLYVVTKKSAFGGKKGVYGFIIPYYPKGMLRDVLPAMRVNRTLEFSQQLEWSKQITSALIHTWESGTFYSDLRPDNILLSDANKLVLIDFESRGSWYEWSAPEICYRAYQEHLAEHGVKYSVQTSGAVATIELFKAFADGKRSKLLQSVEDVDSTTISSRNMAWFALIPEAREKAMVFSLGMLLYCIFEATCNPCVSLNNAWAIEPHIAFPKFEQTPEAMQDLIRRCTADAPEWRVPGLATGTRRFTRDGDRIVSAVDARPGSEQSFGDVLKAVSAAWEQEIWLSNAFFRSDDWINGRVGQARPTLRQVMKCLEDISR